MCESGGAENTHDHSGNAGICWSRLNRDQSTLIKGVLDHWAKLVASDAVESVYQAFLAEHAGLFFGNHGTSFVIGQLELGSEKRPDLVVVQDARSGGLHYQFIELKRPSHPPYTSAGVPSQELNRALQQVRDWKDYLDSNQEFLRKYLPAKYYAGRSCSFTVIIGRRDNSAAHLLERNNLSSGSSYRLSVRSYDYLTDELALQQFADACSPYWISADEGTLRELANPFFKAFTDKQWRGLLKRLEQKSYEGLAAYELHFLTTAAPEVIACRKNNRLYTIFRRRLQEGGRGQPGIEANA